MKNLLLNDALKSVLGWFFEQDVEISFYGIIVLLLLSLIGKEFGKRFIKFLANVILDIVKGTLKAVLRFIQSDGFRKFVLVTLVILLVVGIVLPFTKEETKTTYDVELKADSLIKDYEESVNKLIELCSTPELQGKCDLVRKRFKEKGFTFKLSNS